MDALEEAFGKPRKLETIFENRRDLTAAHMIMGILILENEMQACIVAKYPDEYEILNKLRRNGLIYPEADTGNHGGEIKPYTAIIVPSHVKKHYFDDIYNDYRR